MPKNGKRRGSSGHRDRKQVTFAGVRGPIEKANRRALRRGGFVGERDHQAGLDAFSRRVLGLKPGPRKAPSDTTSG